MVSPGRDQGPAQSEIDAERDDHRIAHLTTGRGAEKYSIELERCNRNQGQRDRPSKIGYRSRPHFGNASQNADDSVSRQSIDQGKPQGTSHRPDRGQPDRLAQRARVAGADRPADQSLGGMCEALQAMGHKNLKIQ